ncbi:MAG: glycosyltransferase [Pseudomonadota bacterium]
MMNPPTPEPLKVGFVLLSNSRKPIPSTRIASLNMFPFLRAAHFEPHIVFEPEHGNERPDVSGLAPRIVAEGFKIVVFQKVHGPTVEALARKLSEAGVRTVFCVCDVIDVPMAQATDATVVVTEFLKSLYPAALQAKIHVVHDGIEHPDMHRLAASTRTGSLARPLRAVLVTSAQLDRLPQIISPPSWLSVTVVGRYASTPVQRLREARWTLLEGRGKSERLDRLAFMAHWRIRCAAWDAARVYKHMLDADVGIIPVDAVLPDVQGAAAPSWMVKSENRLSMKMCLGLPVVATPIPSYLPLVSQGSNGFLAGTRKQWMEYLNALRDPALRQRVGANARQSVLQRYSMQEQARLLIAVFESLRGGDYA